MSLLPLTLLTGFLGSGKTTVLNQLLCQPAMAGTLAIINEFGAVGLDHLLVTHSTESVVVEMSSGCLCCTIRGDLAKTLRDITWRFAKDGVKQFDRVVVETTGLADPAPILHTLMTDEFIASRYRLDGVIAVVDLVNAEDTLNQHPESVKQVAVADRLLLTKEDLVSLKEVELLEQRLRRINPTAAQLLVRNGYVLAEEILNLGLFSPKRKEPDVQAWLRAEALLPNLASSPALKLLSGVSGRDVNVNTSLSNVFSQHPDINRHDDHIRAFCFIVDDPIDPLVLATWLEVVMTLMGDKMLRIKGVLNISNQTTPMVIHGVQHIFYPPVYLECWATEDRRSKFVFITRDIDQKTIEKTFFAIVSARPILEEAPW